MEIVIGDDLDVIVNLTISGLPFIINPVSVVKAAIVDKSNTKILAGPILVSNANTGSDWTKSTLSVLIPGRLTTAIPFSTPAKLEIQVDDGTYKRTWFSNVSLIKGLIK